MTAHICQAAFNGVGDMRGAYDRAGLLPTSENADIFLIRSHIAYWSGSATAERLTIKASRGHSYKVTGPYIGNALVIRIHDEYDHRNGVTGWN